jgi:rhodanese-related sulfurtransferase
MRRPGVIIPLIFLVISACSRVETIPPERANEMMSSGAAVVVDIRDPKKYADGHIRRAMNAEYHPKTFARDTERIDRNAAVILYCGTGLKTKKAAGELERRGFSRVYVIEGGMEAWKKAGFPVTGR